MNNKINNNSLIKSNNFFKKIDINVNKLDDGKKRTFQNRTLISIYVFIYYILVILFSFFSDETQVSKLIIKDSFPESFKIVFSILYLFIIYAPFVIAMIEINRFIFGRNWKTLVGILISGTLFFFLPNLSYLSFKYLGLFNDKVPIAFYSSELDGKINELNKIRLFFGTILASMLITIIVMNVMLGFTKLNNFKNVLTLNFIMFIVPFGFMSFGIIGLLKSWVVLLFIFFSVVFTDASCYIVGLMFGKTKMAPAISPNKTWEGAIGGSIIAIIGLMVYSSLWKIDATNVGFKTLSIFASAKDWVNWIWILCTSITLVVISIMGDLTFSYIKRNFNIKDYGTILKSHGGILDRVDSLVFVTSTYAAILFVVSSMVNWNLFG
ncbi:phosphatidate cytidylyltransferase [Malacoplasma muris]|uniref:phosphatidate cytidylyltransferase n=1 Tax=Malacoplasma muris TaxID=2119 RepID=UPI00398F0175